MSKQAVPGGRDQRIARNSKKAVEHRDGRAERPYSTARENTRRVRRVEHQVTRMIDRAIRKSPPPLDDVGGVNPLDFDEKDPYQQRLMELTGPVT